jgi:hypothetical protein
MRANYKCATCDITKKVIFPIVEGPPKEVLCDNCKEPMQREWSVGIHIPEDFADDLTTTISQRMAHAAMPSGKTKINY